MQAEGSISWHRFDIAGRETRRGLAKESQNNFDVVLTFSTFDKVLT